MKWFPILLLLLAAPALADSNPDSSATSAGSPIKNPDVPFGGLGFGVHALLPQGPGDVGMELEMLVPLSIGATFQAVYQSMRHTRPEAERVFGKDKHFFTGQWKVGFKFYVGGSR